ncbi:MAG: SpoIID/LytB domain-containing protein [Actinomycetota bacterium]
MRRLRTLALVVAVIAAPFLLALPVALAGARAGEEGFTFYGSGWGHGLGLSQWGAYGLAKQGWGAERILEHFYTGAEVGSVAKPPGDIRVGLTTGERRVHLTAKAGPVRLWVRRPLEGTLVGKIPAGQTWTVEGAADGYRVLDAAGAPVGDRTWGGRAFHLFATYTGEGARAIVAEGGSTYNRGFLEFNLTACASACRIRLIAVLPFEEYLLGIGEVPSSWPMEALRTQAIAARSFALYRMRSSGLRGDCNCHVQDGSNDQVYVGWDKEGGTDGERWVRAVDSTVGRIVTYAGKVALTVFTASDGGHTEDLPVQWGTPLELYPYLAGVCDPGEYTSANPWTDWNRAFTVAQVTSALAPYTGAIGSVSGFGRATRGVSGRIDDIVVRGADGTATVSGAELRSALSLPDDRVWINVDRNVLGPIRVTYDDLMCRPGLPTSAVKALPGGSRQTFQQGGIYRNGGLDLTVWISGAIYAEYMGVGGAPGVLGLPVSDRIGTATARSGTCPGCGRMDFANGRIYRTPGLGAFALWGPVLDEYLARGGAGGALGSPTSRVQEHDGGRASATFERGLIICPASGSCTVT